MSPSRVVSRVCERTVTFPPENPEGRKMESVEEMFRRYMLKEYPTYVLHEDQMMHLRRAFFAGAESMFCQPHIPKDVADRLQNQFDEFNKHKGA
jgi:hypothetical protein